MGFWGRSIRKNEIIAVFRTWIVLISAKNVECVVESLVTFTKNSLNIKMRSRVYIDSLFSKV